MVGEERLQAAVATPGLQQILKAVQEGKLVLVCLQNAQTKDSDAAMKGVKEIKADEQFSEVTEVIKLDPSDPKEARLVAQLKVEPTTKRAATVVVAPPGVIFHSNRYLRYSGVLAAFAPPWTVLGVWRLRHPPKLLGPIASITPHAELVEA